MQKKRAIASAQAFLGCRFDLLVDIVGLDPKGDWNLWEDSEGNQLRIAKNKAVHVLPAKHEPTSTMDVFRKAHPALIAKHSYWALSLFGDRQSMLCFLGDDGTLRCCYFENNTWQYNMSPVLLGYKALRYVISGYIETDSRRLRTLSLPYPKDFHIEEAWASGYPTTDRKLQERIVCHLTSREFQE
jgi:hypothetical protein